MDCISQDKLGIVHCLPSNCNTDCRNKVPMDTSARSFITVSKNL